MSVQIIRFAPGLKPVLKHQEHDQSTHGNWADSGSPKLTIMGQNDGTNEFFNENTRVVRYQPKGKEPVDYVIFNDGQSEIFAFKKPTDGTTINGFGYGPNSPKPVARLDVAGPGATAYRSSASKDNNATIAGVIVNASHRRRGLASAMLRFHRDMYPELNVQHSDALLDDGKAWSDVVKHEQHDQSTHGNWATGNVGNFTLDASSDPMGLTTYNHPNGSRIIFQGVDNYYDDDGNPTPEKKEKIAQAVEIIDSLQNKYPLENLTVVFENDPDGENVVVYPIMGQAINIQRSAMNREELEGTARPLGMLSKDLPNGKRAGSYIVINSMVLGNDSKGVPYTYKTLVEANNQTPNPNHLIGNDFPVMLSTITHEYGHALDTRSDADAKFSWNMMDDSSTSLYGQTNKREYFAETFTAWELDRNNPKWQKSFNWLNMDKVGTKVNKSVGSKILFIVKDRFDGGEPFLQEFGEVLKHEGGGHDQATHGNWADGVGSPKAGSDEQEAMYASAYSKAGFKPLENFPLKEGEKPEEYQNDWQLKRDWEDINAGRISEGLDPIDFYAIEQSPVMTKWEFKALRSYLGSGATEHINPWARSDRPLHPETKNITTLKIASLDSLISKVPEVKSETPLFRIFNKYVAEKMEVGQVFKDKGFFSTSFADVTDPKNIKLRNEMNFMQPTGVIGRIVPNGHYSGLSVNHVQQDMFYKHEKEFLMPRGSEFRYLGLGKTPSGETVMDFERVSG